MKGKWIADRAKRVLIAGMLGPLVLAGCATTSASDGKRPSNVEYVCPKGRVLSVTFGPEHRSAAVKIDGKELALQRVGADQARVQDHRFAPKEKYSDGRYSLYVEGERVTMDEGDQFFAGPCISRVPLPPVSR